MIFDNYPRIVEIQKEVIGKLCPLIDSDYVLLDFPNFGNIGDNLIWKGQLEFLSKYVPYKKLYSSNYYAFQPHKVPPGSIILLSGGGNFGDLYPASQNFRLDIVARYPDHRIIVFPQSVFYQNTAVLEEEASILNQHPDLHICVRDQTSFEMLAAFIDPEKLLLLPDMAFFLDLRHYFNNAKSGKTLFMLRQDFERRDSSILGLEDFVEGKLEVRDWPNVKTSAMGKRWFFYSSTLEWKLSHYLSQVPVLDQFIHPEYGLRRKDNMERLILMGINFMNGYDKIISTRLHGMILAVLLNKPVVVLDNSYGKCTSFYHTWLEGFTGVYTASSFKQQAGD